MNLKADRIDAIRLLGAHGAGFLANLLETRMSYAAGTKRLKACAALIRDGHELYVPAYEVLWVDGHSTPWTLLDEDDPCAALRARDDRCPHCGFPLPAGEQCTTDDCEVRV